jgi:hypothetical protein
MGEMERTYIDIYINCIIGEKGWIHDPGEERVGGVVLVANL